MSDSLAFFTLLHVAISVAGILTGLVAVGGMLASTVFRSWFAAFLLATTATSVTGFFFPFHGFTPAIGVGILSLPILFLSGFAFYAKPPTGRWRTVFVVSTLAALYLNTFVLVAQLFLRLPALHQLAPNQNEAPFAVTQLVLLGGFVALTVIAAIRLRSPTRSSNLSALHA